MRGAMPRLVPPPSDGTPGGLTPGRLASRPLVRIVLLAIGIRLLSALLGFAANVVFPLKVPEQFTVFGRTHHFFDTFARWDSGWYVGIARDGYAFVEGGRSNLAFFPAYPMAMRAAGHLLGGRTEHFFLGGVLVSWLAFAGAMVLLWKLARLDLTAEDADRAVFYAAVFPFAFFFGMAYSESLYLLLMVGTALAVRTRHWAVAGVVGALAMVSRVNAIVALPALAWLAWKAAGDDRHHRISAAIALSAMGTGFALWCGYTYMLSGNPLEWAASIKRWEYHPGQAPWTPFVGLVQALVTQPFRYFVTDPMAAYDTFNGLTALAFALATPWVWWRFGAGYGLFMAANLALPLSSGQFVGLGRYCSVLFPFAIALAAGVRSTTTHNVLVFVMATLYFVGLAKFVNIHPIY
jgi:hypothetical protein